jgi:hypothetical protein
MFAPGPFSRAPHSAVLVCLALAWTAGAQTRTERTLLISRIAGSDPTVAADVTRILSTGSRGWEPCLAAPMVVEQTDANGRKRSFYFALEAGFLTETPHLPAAPIEKAFAQEVDRLLRKEGPAPWPIYVFSGRGAPQGPLDSVSLATTMRILVRTPEGGLQAASAIVLNSPYWGARSSFAPEDPYPSIVARHELYHARRAWTRASAIGAGADAIEAAFAPANAVPSDRAALETLVSQALIAGEETAAIDRSIAAPGISPQRRLSALEYRARNAKIEDALAERILDLFPAAKDVARPAQARQRVVRLLEATVRE